MSEVLAAENKGTDNDMTNTTEASPPASTEAAPPSRATLLAAFTGLKIDQTQRFILREIAFYLALFANIAIVALYEMRSHDLRFLLLIPFASAILFWIYAANQSAIRAIRRYIMTVIVPKLSSASATDGLAFGWDDLGRGTWLGRLISNGFRIFTLWITFSGVSLLVLLLNVPADPTQDWLWLSAAGAAILPYILWVWFIIL